VAKLVGETGRIKSPPMKVVWSRPAIRHLVYLREYTGKDSEQNAALVAKRILKAVALLENHPEMGRPGGVLGTRELVVLDTPYIIPYRVRRERLELIALFHGRQKWPSKL
jgi:toxin ParE1/3/4